MERAVIKATQHNTNMQIKNRFITALEGGFKDTIHVTA